MSFFKKYYLFTLVLLAGCEEPSNNEASCPAVIPPALVITIIDQETSEPISCAVSIEIEDTNYLEELSNPDSVTCDNNLSLSGAHDRDGIYNVHVYKEGYLDWSKYNIEVTTGKCGVNTIHITALLER